MLSSDDVELVHRDTALPGLGLVLDPTAVARAVSAVLPDIERAAAEITYVRYKPATSCLVAYRADVGDRVIDFHAKALRANETGRLRRDSLEPRRPGSIAGARVVLTDQSTIVSFFPNDRNLKSLYRLITPKARRSLLGFVLRDRPDLWDATLHTMRYKPERRYVAQLAVGGTPAAVLKFHNARDFQTAQRAAKVIRSRGDLRVACRIGRSKRHRAVASEWMSGKSLSEMIDDTAWRRDDVARVGCALAELHAQDGEPLPHRTSDEQARDLMELAASLAVLCPQVADRVQDVTNTLTARGAKNHRVCGTVHGDFYANQILLNDQGVTILDLDQAHRGNPAEDLGNFVAHLEYERLAGRLGDSHFNELRSAFLSGYQDQAGAIDIADMECHTIAGLLRLAPHAFRQREPHWSHLIDAIVDRANTVLVVTSDRNSSTTAGSNPCAALHPEAVVDDPFDVVTDDRMGFLARVIDPLDAERVVSAALTPSGLQVMRILSIRVRRYKPGRRCLVEYVLDQKTRYGSDEVTTLLGKARAKGCDVTTYRLHQSLWQCGFCSTSADGVSVPEPIAIVPEYQMWLQRKVVGAVATSLLDGPQAADVARRIVGAVHKLHNANVPTKRRHTIADELTILDDRLTKLVDTQPRLKRRIETLLCQCHELGAGLSGAPCCGIHRDFYPDQVIVDGDRVTLLDMDLYCQGDPALDIGNFRAHLTEQSFRSHGRPNALEDAEFALEDEFARLAGKNAAIRARAYTMLSLARHIFISTRFPERRHLTEPLLALCEERLTMPNQART